MRRQCFAMAIPAPLDEGTVTDAVLQEDGSSPLRGCGSPLQAARALNSPSGKASTAVQSSPAGDSGGSSGQEVTCDGDLSLSRRESSMKASGVPLPAACRDRLAEARGCGAP